MTLTNISDPAGILLPTPGTPPLRLSEAGLRAVKARVSPEDGKRLDEWRATGFLVIV